MLERAAVQAPAADRSARRTIAAVALLTLLGLGLRLAAARGDLWLDEVWSFTVVAKARSYADVVLALPYDNNHVLNSLWLRFVGPAAPSLLARLPPVMFGTLCIPVAARLGARVSPLAAVTTAALVAVDQLFVQFGSEARGYAGLMLAMLVALDALEARLKDTTARRSLVGLAFAVAFGTFSHLIMVEVAGLVCTVAAIRSIQAEGPRGLRRLPPIVMAATIGLLPPLACFWISLASGPLHVGLTTPFSYPTFADGLGGMVRIALGLWPKPLPRAASEVLLPALGCLVLVSLRRMPPARRVLPAVGLVLLPLVHAVLHLPNQFYARFHLVTGVCLVLFVAELGARAWMRGDAMRGLAAAAAAVILGQAAQLAPFLTEGRGRFAEATAIMTERGAMRVGVLPSVAAPETAAVMRWYAHRAGSDARITLVPEAAICAGPPDWLVVVHRPDDASDLADATRLSALPCVSDFGPVRRFPASGMSGFAWTLLSRRKQP